MKIFKKKKEISRDGKPLLARWNLFECRFFSIKIHKLLSSDDACLHDHPWAFLTILLSGGYVEHTPKFGQYSRQSIGFDFDPEMPERKIPKKSRVCSRFSILYRPAYYAHRLEIHQPVYTLVFTFKKVREWGFFTPKGFVKWYRYDDSKKCD